MDKLRGGEAESKKKQRLNFNQRHSVVPLKALQPGTPVFIKESGSTGYLIEMEKG